MSDFNNLVFADRSRSASLVLRDGTVFEGRLIGRKSVAGEVVFNTGMVGYPESFTDPSCHGQILVLTYPLIGNYGVPDNKKDIYGLMENFESDSIKIKALVISELSMQYSHWKAVMSLEQWLSSNDVPILYDVDTRELTKNLRESGVMPGKIIAENDIEFEDPNKRNLVAEVSTTKPVIYGDTGKEKSKKIILIDCGVKYGIIRSLLNRGFVVKRVPWNYNFLNESFDGVVISNGPGDPKTVQKTIETTKELLKDRIPIFGICLGNEILGLAAGCNTVKMLYGHRSQNQPCIDTETGKCYITTQNHGYVVKDMPYNWDTWFVNANDKTVEGIKHSSGRFMSVQFHPEAKPGPVDTGFLFDKFYQMVTR